MSREMRRHPIDPRIPYIEVHERVIDRIVRRKPDTALRSKI